MSLPRTYDDWKTTPDDPIDEWNPEDPDCTCTPRRKDKYCPTHGIDPDRAYDEWRDRQMEGP